MEGNILKMKGEIVDGVVQYKLPIGGSLMEMNSLISKRVRLEFSGQINDIETGEKIKKSYSQGYSYKSFLTLPQCDMCMMKPETCHFDKGTCRDENWAKKQCFIPHYVYLSLTSSPKVGITRHHQIPTRWIDQGATKAVILAEVENRLEAGQLEVYLAENISDKTNWREMLKGNNDMDISFIYEEMIEHIEMYMDQIGLEIEIPEFELTEINYPVESFPEKIKSYNLDKNPIIEDVLIGIKGQYLIFENGVINLRKYQGYYLNITHG